MADYPGYRLRDGDDREFALRQIRARRGQQAFRDMLRMRYGDRCIISGSTVLHVLEAAHICPYRGEDDNHPENGLLLRADLHTLFDLDLVGIEPTNLQIRFNPMVLSDEYRERMAADYSAPIVSAQASMHSEFAGMTSKSDLT